MTRPRSPMRLEEAIGFCLSTTSLKAVRLGTRCFHLGSYERGPFRLTVFIQPVGIDQSGRVIVSIRDDRSSKCIAIVHLSGWVPGGLYESRFANARKRSISFI
jgi:hypothetical protein